MIRGKSLAQGVAFTLGMTLALGGGLFASANVSHADTTIDSTAMESQIVTLQQEVATLQTQMAALETQMNLSGSTSGTTGGTGTGTTGTSTDTTSGGTTDGTGTAGALNAMINPSGANVRSGTSIDFTGSGFGTEEIINVTMNGNQVSTAHADGSGNFSTGSLPVGTTLGTYTYTFTGQISGRNATALVTVVE